MMSSVYSGVFLFVYTVYIVSVYIAYSLLCTMVSIYLSTCMVDTVYIYTVYIAI